ncbi:MerR family transcriptional regulator [Pseudactinotalea sp. HY160]|nr:MerR family transcriptional regulator [Pseudactinotalea sp. HY160]
MRRARSRTSRPPATAPTRGSAWPKRRRPEGRPMARYDAPIYLISIAADLAGMHPQTLRSYDRLGLVVPQRTAGRGRRYSPRDVDVLREVQRLSQEEGINLAGIKRILELAVRNEELELENARLRERQATSQRVFAASSSGDVVALPLGTRLRRAEGASRALVVWRQGR